MSGGVSYDLHNYGRTALTALELGNLVAAVGLSVDSKQSTAETLTVVRGGTNRISGPGPRSRCGRV